MNMLCLMLPWVGSGAGAGRTLQDTAELIDTVIDPHVTFQLLINVVHLSG